MESPRVALDEVETSGKGLVEVFCVDISQSMWFSRTFPYFLGTSKLNLSKQIIQSSQVVTTLDMSQGDSSFPHYSSLVMFHSIAKQVVPFSRHTTDQVSRILQSLDDVIHVQGTAIFEAIKYCEQLTLQFTQLPENSQTQWITLLHLFSDGEDNSSNQNEIKNFKRERLVIQSGSGQNLLHHRFLYSFNEKFEQVKLLAETLEATVVMVKNDSLPTSLEERDKIIFQFFRKQQRQQQPPNPSTLSKRRSKGFCYLKGDKPDLVVLHQQLLKAEVVFQGKLIETEGIFRQNAGYNKVFEVSGRFIVGRDTLDDYVDPIVVGHTFKNSLREFEVIPKAKQQDLILSFIENEQFNEKMQSIESIISSFPPLNIECLMIVLRILKRVSVAQEEALKSSGKALSTNSLAIIFAPVLFEGNNDGGPGEGGTENTSYSFLQANLTSTTNLLACLIENVEIIDKHTLPNSF